MDKKYKLGHNIINNITNFIIDICSNWLKERVVYRKEEKGQLIEMEPRGGRGLREHMANFHTTKDFLCCP